MTWAKAILIWAHVLVILLALRGLRENAPLPPRPTREAYRGQMVTVLLWAAAVVMLLTLPGCAQFRADQERARQEQRRDDGAAMTRHLLLWQGANPWTR